MPRYAASACLYQKLGRDLFLRPSTTPLALLSQILGRGMPAARSWTSALLLQMPIFRRCSYVTLLAFTAWSRRIVNEGRDASSLQYSAPKSSFRADAVN